MMKKIMVLGMLSSLGIICASDPFEIGEQKIAFHAYIPRVDNAWTLHDLHAVSIDPFEGPVRIYEKDYVLQSLKRSYKQKIKQLRARIRLAVIAASLHENHDLCKDIESTEQELVGLYNQLYRVDVESVQYDPVIKSQRALETLEHFTPEQIEEAYKKYRAGFCDEIGNEKLCERIAEFIKLEQKIDDKQYNPVNVHRFFQAKKGYLEKQLRYFLGRLDELIPDRTQSPVAVYLLASDEAVNDEIEIEDEAW